MNQTDAFARADFVPREPAAEEIVPRGPDAAELAPLDEDLTPAEREDADGIVGTGAPKHGWPGIAFVWTLALGGIVAVGRVLFLLRDPGGFTPGQVLATLPMMLFPAALVLWMAWKIQTFRLVGLGVAMLFLFLSMAASIILLLEAQDVTEIGFGLLKVGLAVLWMGYLWSRRSDFS